MKNTYLILVSFNLSKGSAIRARKEAFCKTVTSLGYLISNFLITISEGVEAVGINSVRILIELFFKLLSSCRFEGFVLRIVETFEKRQTVEFSL